MLQGINIYINNQIFNIRMKGRNYKNLSYVEVDTDSDDRLFYGRYKKKRKCKSEDIIDNIL